MMKAMLPKGYNQKGPKNIQQLAQQAQKIQDDMAAASKELEGKEYSATSGGGAVKVVATGKIEIKSIEIDPEVVDKNDLEMLSDMIIAAVNESLRSAVNEKEQVMDELSSGINIPGLF